METVKLVRHDAKKILQLLDEGKIVEFPAEYGERVKTNLAKGFHSKFNAKFEKVRDIKEDEDFGLCGCGKPANIIVRCSR